MNLVGRSLVFILAMHLASVAQAFCVNASFAQLREGPGTKYPISWVVGRYMPLVEVARQGNWVQVADLDGQKHWIHRSLLTNTFQCLVVKGAYAQLRTGPGSHYPLAERKFADRYTPFRRFELREGWYEVQDSSGAKAWIHESLVWLPLKVLNINF